MEDQVGGQGLRAVVEEHRHAVVVRQGDLLRLPVGIDHRRLCDRAFDHGDHVIGGGLGLRAFHSFSLHRKVDGRINTDAVEQGEVFGGGVNIGVVGVLVQVGPDLAVEDRVQDQADQVPGNAANIVVLHGFKGLDQGFDLGFDVGFAGGEGSSLVRGTSEEGGVQFGRHGVDMVVSAARHDVSDAEGVQVELCGFLHDLAVGVQVDGGRGNRDRVALAGGSGGSVCLGRAVLKTLILHRPSRGVAGVGLGLQARRQGFLLNVGDHQTGQFGQFDLRRPVLDQADSFGSCH